MLQRSSELARAPATLKEPPQHGSPSTLVPRQPQSNKHCKAVTLGSTTNSFLGIITQLCHPKQGLSEKPGNTQDAKWQIIVPTYPATINTNIPIMTSSNLSLGNSDTFPALYRFENATSEPDGTKSMSIHKSLNVMLQVAQKGAGVKGGSVTKSLTVFGSLEWRRVIADFSFHFSF